MAVDGDERANRASITKPDCDPRFTDAVIAATGPNANQRLAQIMPSLIRHLHDFAREVDLTVAEWAAGVDMVNQAGQMSDDKRNETQLLCDVLGLESLVDDITSKLLLRSPQHPHASAPTPSAVLGPFYRADAPLVPHGASILQTGTTTGSSSSSSSSSPSSWSASLAHLSGRVLSAATGDPVPGAVLDVWQAAPNGLYEQQDASQPDMNLRGRFRTTAPGGAYALRCLRPAAYPVPGDGPAGRLLALLDRHPYRPGHVHFVVTAPGFRALTTQLFDAEDPYCRDDSVFAVKEELMVRFREREKKKKRKKGEGEDEVGSDYGGDEEARWELVYDFYLAEE